MTRQGQAAQVKLSASLGLGAGRPVAWEAGVKITTDEPVPEIMAAIDATLAQVRSQLEIDVREICR